MVLQEHAALNQWVQPTILKFKKDSIKIIIHPQIAHVVCNQIVALASMDVGLLALVALVLITLHQAVYHWLHNIRFLITGQPQTLYFNNRLLLIAIMQCYYHMWILTFNLWPSNQYHHSRVITQLPLNDDTVAPVRNTTVKMIILHLKKRSCFI